MTEILEGAIGENDIRETGGFRAYQTLHRTPGLNFTCG